MSATGIIHPITLLWEGSSEAETLCLQPNSQEPISFTAIVKSRVSYGRGKHDTFPIAQHSSQNKARMGRRPEEESIIPYGSMTDEMLKHTSVALCVGKNFKCIATVPYDSLPHNTTLPPPFQLERFLPFFLRPR